MTTTKTNTSDHSYPGKVRGNARAHASCFEGPRKGVRGVGGFNCCRKRGRGGVTQVEAKILPSPELNPRGLDFFCFSVLDPETASAYFMKAKAQGKQDER